jgi:hypothetical protein
MSIPSSKTKNCTVCGKGYHDPFEVGHLFQPPRQGGYVQKVSDEKRFEAVERCMKGEGFKEIGKEYGVSPSTVRQWCEYHGLEGAWKNRLGLRKGFELAEQRRKAREGNLKPEGYPCTRCGRRSETPKEHGKHLMTCKFAKILARAAS